MKTTEQLDSLDPSPESNLRLANRRRIRRELQWAGGTFLFGLIALPAVIYGVGVALLGPYDVGSGGAAHMGSFYGDVFRGLFAPGLAAWSIVLGPMVIVMLVRLILLPWPRDPAVTAPDAASDEGPPPAQPTRREPFIGG